MGAGPIVHPVNHPENPRTSTTGRATQTNVAPRPGRPGKPGAAQGRPASAQARPGQVKPGAGQAKPRPQTKPSQPRFSPPEVRTTSWPTAMAMSISGMPRVTGSNARGTSGPSREPPPARAGTRPVRKPLGHPVSPGAGPPAQLRCSRLNQDFTARQRGQERTQNYQRSSPPSRPQFFPAQWRGRRPPFRWRRRFPWRWRWWRRWGRRRWGRWPTALTAGPPQVNL